MNKKEKKSKKRTKEIKRKIKRRIKQHREKGKKGKGKKTHLPHARRAAHALAPAGRQRRFPEN
jgi:hypothetical protein